MHKVNRREFAKSLAIAPIGLAAVPSLLATAEAQAPAPAAPTAAAQKAPAAFVNPDTIFILPEGETFAEPIQFAHKPLPLKVQPFALGDVTLEDGPLKQAREWNRGFILRLPNDRLLHTFRVNAGIPSSAKPLGGWEAPKSEIRGHFVGHYLSACALFHASTGDKEVKAKADELVAGLAECQAKLNGNGYLSAFPTEFFDRLDQGKNVWVPLYTLHKIMAGLLDMKTAGRNDQALDVLVKLAGWLDGWTANKTPEHMQQILNVEFGGMNEVLYNLAAVTGDDRWAKVGDRFTKKVFFTPLAQRKDMLKGLHMNTHIPEVIGAARRYELSSDYRFADVARFFFETVTESRTYATGGSSCNEHWLTEPNHLAAEKHVSSNHQECCCAYNMMKLARHLYSWSADPRLFDYYERNLLNHRLGTIEPETGHTMYFLSLSPGAWKETCTEDESFWCCTGSGVEEYSKLNDSIYWHDEESLYVNLFFASKVDWKERGVALEQQTRFPESDRTTLVIRQSPAKAWTLKIRIPGWTTAENRITLNGKPLEVAGTPGSYLTLTRVWKAGDRIEIVLPMRLTAEALADDTTQQAFLYGPLVLAGQFPLEGLSDNLMHRQGADIWEAPKIEVPALKSAASDPAAWIKAVPGQPLTFRTTGQKQDVVLKPLNQSWQRYAVYWTVAS